MVESGATMVESGATMVEAVYEAGTEVPLSVATTPVLLVVQVVSVEDAPRLEVEVEVSVEVM